MNNPQAFTSHNIRANRARILTYLRFPTFEEVQTSTVRGQYDGYKSIEGVGPNSTKETYFKVKTLLASPRWQGVPIFLSSGKKFPKPVKDIVVTFRHTTPCVCPNGQHLKNTVVFSLEPEEKITIQFFSKVPGLSMKTEQKSFEFVYRNPSERSQYVEEYEKLLLDCILGDQTLFVSTDEVECMWKYTDALVNAWEQGAAPLETYQTNSFSIAEKPVPEEIIGTQTDHRMTVGIVGLGKIGSNISKQLAEKGWDVVCYNRTASVTDSLADYGISPAHNLSDFVKQLTKPRIIWLVLPAGEATENMLFGQKGIASLLEPGDIVIDGANAYYKDSIRRHTLLAEKGIKFVDVGISGGPAGARRGAALMVGGDKETFEYLKHLFDSVAVARGVTFFPGVGAGHFVKMIHNGIEYGMMQSIAEGFTVLKNAPYHLDLSDIADIYNHGSVIESRLITWLKEAFDIYGQDLSDIAGSVQHTGEGKWTVETAESLNIKTKIIQEALQFRIDSEKNPSYTGKILSALRNRFGGHTTG